MEDVGLLINLVLALAAAAVGGAVAHRLRQPPIVGYLVAGTAIGPFTPGPVGDLHQVQTLATVGVALLKFAIGIEFSLATLRRVRAIALGGGTLYIILLILLV